MFNAKNKKVQIATWVVAGMALAAFLPAKYNPIAIARAALAKASGPSGGAV